MITALSINTGGLGRMGNCMFTIAGVIGIATKSRQPYGFPEWITKDNEIFGQKPDNINEFLLRPLPPIPNGMSFNQHPYFWGYKDVYLPSGNWTVDAHMQSEKYFKHCLPLIRETFTFKDEPEQNDYVAIHYRAGDYIDDPNAQHPRCSKEYYEKAMALFPEETKFVLFSDDIDTAYPMFINFIRHGQSINTIHFIRIPSNENCVGNYIRDFAWMKSCKSFITANSSFSLMAAILGDHPEKKIICPKRWFGSQMPAEFNTDDIYPENAIVI